VYCLKQHALYPLCSDANSDKHYIIEFDHTIGAGPRKTSPNRIRNASRTVFAGHVPPRQSFHRTLELISVEPNCFGWKLEATGVCSLFSPTRTERRTRLPIETYPPAFSLNEALEGARERKFVRKLVLAPVKCNFIYARYFTEEFTGFTITLTARRDANFDGNLWSHAPKDEIKLIEF